MPALRQFPSRAGAIVPSLWALSTAADSTSSSQSGRVRAQVKSFTVLSPLLTFIFLHSRYSGHAAFKSAFPLMYTSSTRMDECRTRWFGQALLCAVRIRDRALKRPCFVTARPPRIPSRPTTVDSFHAVAYPHHAGSDVGLAVESGTDPRGKCFTIRSSSLTILF
jgi:hypothetical protein